MTPRQIALLWLLGTSPMACSEGPASSGPGDSAPSDSATSSAQGDSGSEDAPAVVDATTPVPNDASTLVAECQALAMIFVNNCHDMYSGDALTPDTQRMCIWTGYSHICQTGNTLLLLDSMRCFGQNPNCSTFSDSNGAAGCLQTVHATGESTATRAFIQKLCLNCSGTVCDAGSGALAELIPYVSSEELATIESCWGTQCSGAAAAVTCASVPDVAAIFGCK